jgi:hypothetical protein
MVSTFHRRREHKPFLIGEGVLHLIAIEELIVGADDRENVRIGKAADTLKGVDNMLLLEFELKPIVNVLPLASTAGAKMPALRRYTVRRRPLHIYYLGLCVALLNFQEADLD